MLISTFVHVQRQLQVSLYYVIEIAQNHSGSSSVHETEHIAKKISSRHTNWRGALIGLDETVLRCFHINYT